MQYHNLYHAIANTANQITGKLLYTCYTQPSHRALHVCCTDCVGHCIFYGMV